MSKDETHEHDKQQHFTLIAIVAIVAIVAMVMLVILERNSIGVAYLGDTEGQFWSSEYPTNSLDQGYDVQSPSKFENK